MSTYKEPKLVPAVEVLIADTPYCLACLVLNAMQLSGTQ